MIKKKKKHVAHHAFWSRGDISKSLSGRVLSHRLQGYLAYKNPPPPEDPSVALCLGNFGDPRGVGVFYERGTLVPHFGLVLEPFRDDGGGGDVIGR